MKRILLLIASATMFLAGCASDPLAAAKEHNVNRVKVEPKVGIPEMRYGLRDTSGNDVSEAANEIVASMYRRKIAQMMTVMQQNHIDVQEMVRTKFTSAAQGLGFSFAETNPDAFFVLRLRQFGFATRVFKDGKFPFAEVEAELRSPEGKLYWRGSAIATGAFVKKTASTWQDYELDPEKLRGDWEKVIAAATKNALNPAKHRNQILFGQLAH